VARQGKARFVVPVTAKDFLQPSWLAAEVISQHGKQRCGTKDGAGGVTELWGPWLGAGEAVSPLSPTCCPPSNQIWLGDLFPLGDSEARMDWPC